MTAFRAVAAAALFAISAPPAFAAPKAKGAAWIAAKADARRWTAALLEGVAKSGQYDVAAFKAYMDRAWDLAESTETAQKKLHSKRVAAVPAAKDLSRKMLELNLLYVYGNIFPRLVDESTDLAPGRAYAGGDLHASIEEEDFRAQAAALRNGAEFPPHLMRELPRPRRAAAAGSR